MTPEAETILLTQLATVLHDLHEDGVNDGEAMFMLGASADYFCGVNKVDSWPSLKSALSPANVNSLLAYIDAEGPKALENGQGKQAYALQLIGLSIAATTARNLDVLAGADLLDGVIAKALQNFHQHARDKAPKPN